MSGCPSPLPPGESVLLQLFSKHHLNYFLRDRDSAYEIEMRLTQFIMQQALECNAHRTASMLSLTLAQWIALKCHQYRKQKILATTATVGTGINDGGADATRCQGTTRNQPERLQFGRETPHEAQILHEDELCIERFSSRQLRRDIELARDYLDRCGGLAQQEEWPQVGGGTRRC